MNSKTQDVVNVPVAEIIPGDNDRKRFDKDGLSELAASIRENGLVQPITVRPIQQHQNDGYLYQIVAGERRFRAVNMLGWRTIPAIVREMSDAEAANVMLIENVNREDLTPIEEAKAYRKRLDQGISVFDLAELTGKSIGYLRRRLALLTLTDGWLKVIEAGVVTVSFADTAVRLTPDGQKMALRVLLANPTMTVVNFRGVCDKILQDEQQGALFDISEFLIAPSNNDGKVFTTGRSANFAPPSNDLPLPKWEKTDATGDAIHRYYLDLLEAGHIEGAAAVANLYRMLLDKQRVCIPNWRRYT